MAIAPAARPATPTWLLAWLLAGLLTCLLAGIAAAHAQTAAAPETIGAKRFESFMLGAAVPCSVEPARVCIAEAWDFADRDRDGALAAGELNAIKSEMNAWAEWKKPSMGSRARASLAIAQMLVRSLPPALVIEGFDSDADGVVSRAELTQDLTLDERPLPEILQDRGAVDWPSVKERLGAVAPLIGLLAQGGS